ncbi:hypothetical protein Tco_0747675 [Tanacetum coccineum]|uniref:Uncharacterized protein n=1 Tax=Tanacetum coccineum TaxID=301880 RepID=A0ABQ4YTH2_9ASTR
MVYAQLYICKEVLNQNSFDLYECGRDCYLKHNGNVHCQESPGATRKYSCVCVINYVGGGDNNDEYVDEDGVNNTDVNNEDVDDVNLDYIDDDVPIEETCVDYDHVDVDINVDIFDPRNWDSLNSDMIKRLVEKRVSKEINLLRRVLKIKVLDGLLLLTTLEFYQTIV